MVGKITTVVGTILAIVSSPIFGQKDTVFQALTDLICYVAPPITAVFLLGVFWKRATGRAAYLALVLGNLIGVAIFFLELFKEHTGWNSVLTWHQSLTGMELTSMIASFYLCVLCGADRRQSLRTSFPRRSRRRPDCWSGRIGASRCAARPTDTGWATTACCPRSSLATFVVLYFVFR